MTYRELIQKLETDFADHLDDELSIQEPYDVPSMFSDVVPVVLDEQLTLCL